MNTFFRVLNAVNNSDSQQLSFEELFALNERLNRIRTGLPIGTFQINYWGEETVPLFRSLSLPYMFGASYGWDVNQDVFGNLVRFLGLNRTQCPVVICCTRKCYQIRAAQLRVQTELNTLLITLELSRLPEPNILPELKEDYE